VLPRYGLYSTYTTLFIFAGRADWHGRCLIYQQNAVEDCRCFGLQNAANRCQFGGVSAVIITATEGPDAQSQAHEITRRQIQQWFDWMDGILNTHRANFVFREGGAGQLEEHKATLKLAIRTCLWINALIADPDFNEAELVARLQTRTRQLQDAYDTLFDTTLSTEAGEKILKQVFPE